MDVDGSKSIDKSETLKYWYEPHNCRNSNFAKINTEELFAAVDKDNNGSISEREWLDFWLAVKTAGHSEEEIKDELSQLENGQGWVYFDKVKANVIGKADAVTSSPKHRKNN